MNKFQISNFGPIKNLDVELGDLTILLGPQASGKTLFLQLAKLIVDKDYIVQNLLKYNYVIDGDSDKVLNYYFGDRLSSMWKNCTMVKVDGEAFEKCSLLNAENADAKERLFYIPAQRILSISDGRPKNFMEFDISSPYVLRNSSADKCPIRNSWLYRTAFTIALSNVLLPILSNLFNITPP